MAETLDTTSFDYTFVSSIARVALYDDLRSAPRITKIEPARTTDYIEHLATTIHEQSKLAGGKIPYSVIREVSENCIHAQFREIVVSILDDGNTIRFSDQGPGIQDKEKVQKPGFTSAIEPMKEYIRGVGSGFPIVKDYLDFLDGSIVIEDNINAGAVITISLVKQPTVVSPSTISPPLQQAAIPHVPLSEREVEFVSLLLHEGDLGITEIHNITGVSQSSVHNTLKKLEEAGLVEKNAGKKRGLTDIGRQVAATL